MAAVTLGAGVGLFLGMTCCEYTKVELAAAALGIPLGAAAALVKRGFIPYKCEGYPGGY